MPWPRLLALAAWPLALLAVAVGVVGLATSAVFEDVAWFALVVALGVPSLILGTVISGRRPDNSVGALLALMGLAVLVIGSTDTYIAAAERRPDVLPVSEMAVTWTAGGWVWFYAPVALLMLVFPDGRPTGRAGRWLIVAVLATAVVCTALTGVDIVGAPAWAVPLGLGAVVGFFGLLVASAVSIARRLRRSTGIRRAQLTWFALAGLSLPATLLLCWGSYLLLDGPDLVIVGLIVMWLAVPAATAIAMLRHDLYDVDRAASTAVTYAIVSAALLATFTAVSVIGGLALGRGSPITAAVATAICLLALQPLRRRVQAIVERRIHPLRQGAMNAIEDLRTKTYAGEARPEELEAVLRRALRDPQLRVGYRLPGASEFVDVDAFPVDFSDAMSTPVRLGDTVIGVLQPVRSCPRPLLDAVADASALLVEVVRLRLELSRALIDVESSRSRILHAGYAERRRLERDLHDGAQQRLVSLGMSLRIAQRHLEDGTVDVDALLDTTVAELATSVAELRQLAHGLRPSSLDDGLEPALVNLTSRLRTGALPIRVNLDVVRDGLELSDDVSTTAYYVASEAVANVVKHADADCIDMQVARRNGTVHVRVSDNGRGGASLRPGSGLAGLRDRVAALGGSLLVASPPTGGTVVEAVLPCGS